MSGALQLLVTAAWVCVLLAVKPGVVSCQTAQFWGLVSQKFLWRDPLAKGVFVALVA